MLEVKSIRIGVSNYQVPCPVEENRKIYLAMHWLITASKKDLKIQCKVNYLKK